MIKVITIASFDPSPVRDKCGSVLFVQIAFSLDFDHPAFDPERVPFPENRFILEKANAEEINVAFLRWPDLPGAFQGQTNLGQKFLDLFSRGMQLLFIRPQQYKIIDIADIILDPEFLFDEMIQVLQEEIREPLTRIKADRLPVFRSDDRINQPQAFLVFDFLPEGRFQIFCLDRWIEFLHIHLQAVFGVLWIIIQPFPQRFLSV